MAIELQAIILLLLIVVLIAIGLPLAFSIALGSLVVIFLRGSINPVIAPQQLFGGMNHFSLLAIPFFLLAGSIMTIGGLSDRLINFANALVGRLTGGLAISNVIASIFFGGISGSAVADTSAIGGTFIPAMVQKGYGRRFTVGITAASSPISPLIPPSIAWIVYAFITNQSIIRMFVAGIIPGLLYGLGLIFVVYFVAKRKGYPTAPPITLKELFITFCYAIPAILMPAIVLLGILTGIFTVTEASAVAVLYALIASGIIYRKLTVSAFITALRKSARMTAAVMIILAAATLFAWMLAFIHLPDTLGEWIKDVVKSPLAFLLVVNVILLIVGTFMEVNAAKVMLLPVLFPIAMAFEIDPIHFGVVVTVNLCLGLITPPVGIVLVLASKIGNISLDDGVRGVFPFFIVGLVVLVVLTLVPALSTTLPNLLLGPMR